MKKKEKVDLVIDKLVRNKNFIKHINSQDFQDFVLLDKCAKRNNFTENEARELIDNVRGEI